MSTYKVYYFNYCARAEAVRYLLSYGGVEFEDIRFEENEWPKVKPTMPFGKVPVLEADAVKFSHTLAICSFLGEKFNLAGSNPAEKAQIMTAAGFVYDLIGFAENVVESYMEATNKDGFEKAIQKLTKETIPEKLAMFDALVAKNNGFLANGKLSWADIYFVSFADYFHDLFAYGNIKVEENFFENCENLKKLIKEVEAIEGIKKWIEKRPTTIA